jgi:hypothetical protein
VAPVPVAAPETVAVGYGAEPSGPEVSEPVASGPEGSGPEVSEAVGSESGAEVVSAGGSVAVGGSEVSGGLVGPLSVGDGTASRPQPSAAEVTPLP